MQQNYEQIADCRKTVIYYYTIFLKTIFLYSIEFFVLKNELKVRILGFHIKFVTSILNKTLDNL